MLNKIVFFIFIFITKKHFRVINIIKNVSKLFIKRSNIKFRFSI
jgi:hypothetical protein